MTASVEVRVNGKIFDAFESGTVNLTMAEATNSFELYYFAEAKPGQKLVFKGDLVEVFIDADGGKGPEPLITGYVDQTNERDSATGLDLSFAGRSNQDVVDSSIVSPDGSGREVRTRWTNASIDRIVADLVFPLGISSFVDIAPGDPHAQEILKPFPNFHVQHGERVIDAIQRAAVKRGLHPYSVGDGLVLARTGRYDTKTVLERGVNVREWARGDTDYNRFSHYRLRYQAKPTRARKGKDASQLSYAVVDEEVTRYRPLLLEADAHDGLDARQRAELERALRAGQAETLSLYVMDWGTAEGHAWRPNTLAHCKNHVIGIDRQMLVTVARFRFGRDEVREVQLEMSRPEAYDTAEFTSLTLKSRRRSQRIPLR